MTYLAAVSADPSFFAVVWKILLNNGMRFISGAEITLLLSLSGTIVGFGLGLLVAVARNIPLGEKKSLRFVLLKIVRFVLTAYVEFFRGTPMMVQAIVFYYGLQQLLDVDINPLFAGFMIVSINTGAYLAEISRGGIDSIDKGQSEAAHSIGMTYWQTMIHVVLPQAIRNILPALGNEFVINIKDTSVLNVIMVTELFYRAKDVQAATFKTFEPYFIICCIYFVLTYTVTRILRLIEKKIDGPKSYSLEGSHTMVNVNTEQRRSKSQFGGGYNGHR